MPNQTESTQDGVVEVEVEATKTADVTPLAQSLKVATEKLVKKGKRATKRAGKVEVKLSDVVKKANSKFLGKTAQSAKVKKEKPAPKIPKEPKERKDQPLDITCKDCGATRTIKAYEVFQVTRCKACQAKATRRKAKEAKKMLYKLMRDWINAESDRAIEFDSWRKKQA